MNNNLKKIIAFTIICSALSTWIPSTINIGNQCAYAYSGDELTSLDLTSGGSIIPIYSSKSHKYEYRVKSGENIPITVFSKISSNQTNIKLSAIKGTTADIRVFVGSNNIKLADIYSEIKIEKGEKKSIYIRLYDSKTVPDKDFVSEYEVIVERDNNVDTESEDEAVNLKEYGDAYLKDLVLSNNDNDIDFNFDKAQSIYNINVDKNVNYLKIKAVPEQDSYKLRINDEDVDTKGSNKNIRSILLDEDKTLVKIRIISTEHEIREYFLNVTKQTSTSAATDVTTIKDTTVTTTNNIIPQKIQTSGNWQYKNADGSLAIGWTCIDNDWYYFDSTGAMKTGWIQVTPGKWYYLNETGAMVKNTTINGYKIGSDGVFITK